MKFSIVFNTSGDTIPFDAINPGVLEYYVDCLSQQNLNSFLIQSNTQFDDINNKINLLQTRLNEANVWLNELFDYRFPIHDRDGYLDQNNLNHLHSEWVKIQAYKCNIAEQRVRNNFQGRIEQLHDLYPDDEQFPFLGDIVNKLDIKQVFDSINSPLLHGIESSFQDIVYSCSTKWVEFHNPFPKTIITNDQCNLFLPFSHLGRTQYNKFLHYGSLETETDENTFNELLGFVSLSLSRPEKRTYSIEYVQWCNEHRREPSGEIIPLGNIPNLQTNLKKYRIIILRNATANNSFYINLER